MISDCRYEGNSGYYGGAISIGSSEPMIKNCLFINNIAEKTGGAVRSDRADSVFINCSFVDNQAALGGMEIYSQRSGSLILKNCILVDVRLLKIPQLQCGFIIQHPDHTGRGPSFSLPDAIQSIVLARNFSLKTNDPSPQVYRIQHFDLEDIFSGMSDPIPQPPLSVRSKL